MNYNKAREERKWQTNKTKEERELREAGAKEEIIQELYEYDWEVFKSDRRYYEKIQDLNPLFDSIPMYEAQNEINTVGELLDSIERRDIYVELSRIDRVTLEILVEKMAGYSTREIAMHLGLTEKAVYRRCDRLKEKFKKFIFCGENFASSPAIK